MKLPRFMEVGGEFPRLSPSKAVRIYIDEASSGEGGVLSRALWVPVPFASVLLDSLVQALEPAAAP